MEPEEVLNQLMDLATEAGLEVRLAGAVGGAGGSGPDGEPPLESGVCRLRDRVWVVLSRQETPARLIPVLAGALKSYHLEWLDARYLPPAVREAIERAPGRDSLQGNRPT